MNTTVLKEKIEQFLDETMDLNDLPGLAVGVSIGLDGDCAGSGYSQHSHAGFSFTGARGYRDYDSGSPLMPDDIFHCASLSKLFTSSAIMKLVEAGSLGLYDRLSNILPDLKYGSSGNDAPIGDWRFGEIRLWNLLTHTSGLGDLSCYGWDKPVTDSDALRRYVYESPDTTALPMLRSPQVNPEYYGVPETDAEGKPLLDSKGNPAHLFRYSNVAYEILGQIVAEYSDRMPGADGKLSYEDFVARYLLEPAGMRSSTMKTFERCDFNDADERNTCSMVAPYERASDRSIVPVKHYPYTRQHAPSSTLTSTLSDLLRWGRAHISSASGKRELLFSKETYDSIWREYATIPNNGEKMGLGWFMRRQKMSRTDPGSPVQILYGHEGSDDGFRASFWICPPLEIVTAVLSNISNAPAKKINKSLFELACDALR